MKQEKQQEWQGLTHDELVEFMFRCHSPKSKAYKQAKYFYELIEQRLKEKNYRQGETD